MKNILPFLISISGCLSLAAQDFYDLNTIQDIRIYFAQENWDELLDNAYIAGAGERIEADIIINDTEIENVGIRYKGFSSVSVDREKNPFNIKLDFTEGGMSYQGIDKIKLSNVIQDPSFLRETLSYEIAGKYMPASRANYARVYINDEYWGLYTNTESVNDDFLADNFGYLNNPFFKCNPEELDLNGENSNLSNSPGTDSTAYYPYYRLESDYGWTELYDFIDILNESPSEIETTLNVDRALWMHALNYVFVNFDSYVGYAQNYYLYQDESGRFNPILWDLNQSFASYRLTDASEHFDGFSIEQAPTIDPLLHWSSVSVQPRPLLRNLLENDTYRRMFLAHMRTIIEENFADGSYVNRAIFLQNLIAADVEADENKFYTDADFYDNLHTTVADLIEYPGITELMNARTTYLQNYPGYQGAPDISDISSSPSSVTAGGNLFVNAAAENATNVILAYRYGENEAFRHVTMTDDGSQNDGTAGDGFYGAQLTDIGNSVQYYLYAENEEAGRFAPVRAAYEFFTLQSTAAAGEIVINELLAKNSNGTTDEAGQTDDWIELYNTTENTLSVAGLFLSDNAENLQKWEMPDVSIAPEAYLMIWADEDGGQGILHANFKLSGSGETLFLSDAAGNILDSVEFGEQSDDRSYGRFPNGTGDFTEMPTTFSAPNSLTSAVRDVLITEFSVFPNPTRAGFFLHFPQQKPNNVRLYSSLGHILQDIDIQHHTTFINTDKLPAGTCFITCFFAEGTATQAVILE